MNKTSAPLSDTTLGRLIEETQISSWAEALYEENKHRFQSSEDLFIQSPRAFDWTLYLLSLETFKSALVVGEDYGSLSLILAELFDHVTVSHHNPDVLRLIQARASEEKITNLTFIDISAEDPFRFTPHSFDFITVQSVPISIKEMIHAYSPYLKSGGYLRLVLENRWSYKKLLSFKLRSNNTRTFNGYKQILSQNGFQIKEAFFPVPSHVGIPMFYLPVENDPSIRFFLRHIFPLFDAVSPEMKKKYYLEYALAKCTVRLILMTGTIRLLTYFLPGFMIFSEKK